MAVWHVSRLILGQTQTLSLESGVRHTSAAGKFLGVPYMRRQGHRVIAFGEYLIAHLR
jgi:hypothetical protein